MNDGQRIVTYFVYGFASLLLEYASRLESKDARGVQELPTHTFDL